MEVTQDKMTEVTPLVLRVLDEWNLDGPETLNLLGLENKNGSRELRKYRSNAKPLPYSPELATRIAHISGIVDALRTSYPFSAEFRAMWLRQPHRRFAQATPLSVMLKEGLAGLEKVRTEVDCAYGWSVMDGVQNP